MICVGSLLYEGACHAARLPSFWVLVDVPASCGDSTALLASYFKACSKPSRVGFSFFAGVAVLVREEPLRLVDLPKGPFSSGCRFCPRADG